MLLEREGISLLGSLGLGVLAGALDGMLTYGNLTIQRGSPAYIKLTYDRTILNYRYEAAQRAGNEFASRNLKRQQGQVDNQLEVLNLANPAEKRAKARTIAFNAAKGTFLRTAGVSFVAVEAVQLVHESIQNQAHIGAALLQLSGSFFA